MRTLIRSRRCDDRDLSSCKNRKRGLRVGKDMCVSQVKVAEMDKEVEAECLAKLCHVRFGSVRRVTTFLQMVRVQLMSPDFMRL
jgi:hypothetical protein